MTGPELHLFATSLASKWGFDDGDLIGDFLYDLQDAGLIEDDADLGVVDEHAVLRRLVRERLLPVIPLAIQVYEVETNHNPIRASAVDGLEINDTALDQPADRLLEAYACSVPWQDVVRLAGLEVVAGEVVSRSLAEPRACADGS